MILVDLVNYFRNGGDFGDFTEEQSLDIESEVIEIYMSKPFSLDSELRFFEIEKTNGSIEFTLDDIKYYNLFDFYYFLDVIDDVNNIEEYKELKDTEIAEKLLSFAIKDA